MGVEVAERIKSILQEIAAEKGLEISGMELMPDHIHLLVSGPPQYSPSLLVNWFKGISARLCNHRFKDMRLSMDECTLCGNCGNCE